MRWLCTGVGLEEEQPITSVTRRAAKGVMWLSTKCRLGSGGYWVRDGGSLK